MFLKIIGRKSRNSYSDVYFNTVKTIIMAISTLYINKLNEIDKTNLIFI